MLPASQVGAEGVDVDGGGDSWHSTAAIQRRREGSGEEVAGVM